MKAPSRVRMFVTSWPSNGTSSQGTMSMTSRRSRGDIPDAIVPSMHEKGSTLSTPHTPCRTYAIDRAIVITPSPPRIVA